MTASLGTVVREPAVKRTVSTGAEEPIRRRECMVPDLLFPPSFPLVY